MEENTKDTESIEMTDFEEDEDFDDIINSLGDEEEDNSEKETETKKQSKEKNHEYAEARRAKKQKYEEELEKARKEGYEKAQKQFNLDQNKLNVFTNEPIKDEFDLKIYELQKKIKEQGGDPLNDLASTIANEKRTQNLKAKEDEERKKQTSENVKKQISEFRSTFPDVNYEETLKEGSPFRTFADGKLGGKDSIATIYKSYLEFKKAIIDSSTLQQEEENGKKQSYSPSSSGSKSKKAKTVENMTDDEFVEYWKNKTGSF